MKYILIFLITFSIVSCVDNSKGEISIAQTKDSLDSSTDTSSAFAKGKPEVKEGRYNVAFLIMDGTYNTELTAPFDIFQHTQYRENIKQMNVFTVANTLNPIRTFEGMYLLPDFDYTAADLPKIDIVRSERPSYMNM